MSHISDTIRSLQAQLPQGVGLVAVSKFHPAEAIREAYDAGQRIFGESRVQELLGKISQLPSDVRWHFIGHLQTNKVKMIVGKVSMIESIDTEKLLMLVDRVSAELGVTSRVLMQVHVAAEETKFGFSPDELLEFFSARRFESLQATHICGLMGMATNTDDTSRVSADFHAIAALRDKILEISPDLRGFDVLSMGMSHDYPLAIEAGANLIRIGTAIFGDRQY